MSGTFRGHGEQTIRESALLIARSLIGKHEDRDPVTGKGLNTGWICDWSLEGFPPPKKPDAWCARFACQCPRRVLLSMGEDGTSMLAEWRRWRRAGCDELWEELQTLGLTTEHVPGQPPPEDAYFVFFWTMKDGERVYHSDGKPNLAHVGIRDHVAGELLFTVEGNHGDKVAEDRHRLDDPRLFGYARLPW
jgi:hypothetical protein